MLRGTARRAPEYLWLASRLLVCLNATFSERSWSTWIQSVVGQTKTQERAAAIKQCNSVVPNALLTLLLDLTGGGVLRLRMLLSRDALGCVCLTD